MAPTFSEIVSSSCLKSMASSGQISSHRRQLPSKKYRQCPRSRTGLLGILEEDWVSIAFRIPIPLSNSETYSAGQCSTQRPHPVHLPPSTEVAFLRTTNSKFP